MLRHYLLGVLAALSIASAQAAAATSERNPVLKHPPAATEPAEQRILVKLRPSAAAAAHVQAQSVAVKTNATMQSLASRASLTFKESREITNGLHLLKVQPAAGEPIEATLARLRADSGRRGGETDQRHVTDQVGEAEQQDVIQLVMMVAAGDIDEAGAAAFFRDHTVKLED